VGPKQLKYQRIGCLANSPDGCVGSLSFQTTQASAINKCLWVFADRSTTKFSNSVLAKLKTIEKADEKEVQRWASSLMVIL
jgi:hypothetical protein